MESDSVDALVSARGRTDHLGLDQNPGVAADRCEEDWLVLVLFEPS
jgi:hypothetical protein